MYKPSTYLVVVTYFPTYLPIYETYFGYQGETKDYLSCGSYSKADFLEVLRTDG